MIYTQERVLLHSLFRKKSKKSNWCRKCSDAIKDAKTNAVHNEITNCEFFVGDMKVVFNDAFIAQHDAS
jgi:23S rRNA (uracil1939-C5)-methyltransferase